MNDKKKNPTSAYRRKTRGLRLKLFLKELKGPFMYFPPLRKIVMSSGINSIKVINKQGPAY